MADQQPDTILRLPDFIEKYANNVKYEGSDWDLKMVFGVIDQSTSPLTIRQHTTMNVPWSQVKLMSFYLAANVLIHENAHGKINLATGVLPPKASALDMDAVLAEQLDELRSRLLS